MCRSTLFITALALAAGFVAGGMLRALRTPEDSVGEAVAQLEEATGKSAEGTVISLTGDEHPTSLEDVLAARHDAEQFHLLGRFLPGASIEDLERIVDSWGRHYHWSSSAERNKWKLLLARWMELDARGTLDFLDEAGGSEESLQQLRNFCYAWWAERDLAVAVSRAESVPEKALPGLIRAVVENDLEIGLALLSRYPDVRGVAEAVLGKLADSDPVEALRLTETLPLVVKREAIHTVLLAQAERDPEAALANAQKLDLLDVRSDIVKAIIFRVAENDLAEAERLVLTLPPGKTRQEAFIEYARIRAREDPDSALAWAKRFPDGPDKHSAIGRALEAMALRKVDGFDILETLDELGWEYAHPHSESTAASAAAFAIAELAKTDPRRALAYLVKLPASSDVINDVRMETACGIFPGWLDRDPAEALAALESLPSESLRQSVVITLLGTNASEESVRTMAEHLPHIEDKAMVNAGARLVARRFARVDPVKSIEWIDTLPVEAQTRALESAVVEFMGDHPDLAKQEILRMDVGREREASVSRMLSTLAAKDVGQAVDWFETLGPADQHVYAWVAVTSPWFDKDPQAAGDWLYSASPGSGRDHAASNFADKLAHQSDFEAALQWSTVVTDPTARQQSLTATFEKWLATERPAATRALSEAELPANIKRDLLGQ